VAEPHAPYTLFEVSWEICNKVGGIHTVVSTKAKTLTAKLGDDYICIGPWLLSGGQAPQAFEEESGFAEFCERCRALGVPVRVGRWKIPGRPRTILVQFSGLYAKQDGILAEMWERFLVDSLSGGWDYIEPLLFGHAAGMVIEQWHEEHVAPRRGQAVAQFHEWMTGAGMLYLKEKEPAIGTVFTTHATMLGRSISSGDKSPAAGLAGRSPEEAAEAQNIKAKHSMESVCAREADVFTTVSGITADEAELFFHRRAAPLLPNGIDLGVIDELAGSAGAEEAEGRLRDLARRFLGEDASDAALVCISGRYEFHNKGLDLLLDALARIQGGPGRKLVLFVLVPAGNSGVRSELLERLDQPPEQSQGPIGLCTHNLFDSERDPVQQHARKLGLDNRAGARVKLIHIPVYLHESDGFLGLPYEAVLRAMELSVFPSFYEPWGYTPEESLAVGVPTITTDCAGFGRWARSRSLSPEDGVWILPRFGVEQPVAAAELAARIETALAEPRERAERVAICRRTAQLTAWSDLIAPYEEAFSLARSAALLRSGGLAATAFRPRIAVPANPAPQGTRPHLRRFDVATALPAALSGLERLARNYWWSWDGEATALFRELFPQKWDLSRHNPVLFLRQIYPEDVQEKAADAAYVQRLARVLERFDAYMQSAGAAREIGPEARLDARNPVGYFSAEFGVHESLRIYSGGLGILAGDHLKSASDLGLPLVAVGLFYRFGYFQQKLTSSGEQLHGEVENDPRNLPLEPVLDEHGRLLEIRLQLPSSELVLRAWKVAVGRVSLYLLDTNVPENRPEDRDITRTLYGGDQENRLRQEIVLGRGGKRLLAQLGVFPAVFHINEGHAAFLAVERVARLVREFGLTFDEARVLVRATTIFTTHTPVPAGHDRFPEELMRRYFSDAPGWVGVPWERFYALGQGEEDKGNFNMTYLAMNFAGWVNGVSKLHGQVSRKLLHPFWPRYLESEVPVHSVTNGVHLSTWVEPELRALLGARERPLVAADYRHAAPALDARALWEVKLAAKRRMLGHLREAIERAFVGRHDSPSLLNRTLAGLEQSTGEQALWIAFARRFAPYKRAGLLFRDLERLRRLLGRPLRIVFSGKAHPADKHGQEILKQVVALTRRDEFAGRVFFVEEYDIDMARVLVQGVDAWLNNPIRPLEASGTSGMKVAANGGLNLSILDGWWPEACDGRNGWAIGGSRVYPDQALQDELDSETLYRLLEEEVLPLFFQRQDGLPRGWLERVVHSLESVPTQFNTDRMLEEYTTRAYAPLAAAWHALTAERFARTHALAARQARVRKGFSEVKVRAAHMSGLSEVRVGDTVSARVEIELGPLHERDIAVELVLGHKNGEGEMQKPIFVPLNPVAREGATLLTLEAGHRMERSGSFAYGIRVRARPDGAHDLALADLMLWA
jgi:glycogen phosphorylase/synthase